MKIRHGPLEVGHLYLLFFFHCSAQIELSILLSPLSRVTLALMCCTKQPFLKWLNWRKICQRGKSGCLRMCNISSCATGSWKFVDGHHIFRVSFLGFSIFLYKKLAQVTDEPAGQWLLQPVELWIISLLFWMSGRACICNMAPTISSLNNESPWTSAHSCCDQYYAIQPMGTISSHQRSFFTWIVVVCIENSWWWMKSWDLSPCKLLLNRSYVDMVLLFPV